VEFSGEETVKDQQKLELLGGAFGYLIMMFV
jgi:hypothetical protein